LLESPVCGTLGSWNLAPNPGSRNPGFPEPVPGTGETRRQGRAVPRSTPKAMWAQTPKHSAVGE